MSFEAADRGGQSVVIDAAYVDAHPGRDSLQNALKELDFGGFEEIDILDPNTCGVGDRRRVYPGPDRVPSPSAIVGAILKRTLQLRAKATSIQRSN